MLNGVFRTNDQATVRIEEKETETQTAQATSRTPGLGSGKKSDGNKYTKRNG